MKMKLLRNEEMNEPLVSVLLSTYNREDTIRETVKSVLSQTYRNFQFIIVDDGSTDCSCEIVESFNDSRIELVRLPQNRHICYALNVALEKVRGEYIARIDSDDLWVPDKLYKQLTFMMQHPDYKITFTKCDVIDENGENVNDKEKDVFALFEMGNFTGQVDALRYFFYDLNCLAHPSVMMHVDVFKAVGFYNPCYVQSQDFDYWVRVAKKYPIYVMQERLLKYRRFSEAYTGDDNLSRVNDIHGIRYLNEVMNIRAHFFDDMSDELFVQTFRQDFKNPNASSAAELACEKAFLQCVPLPGSNTIPAVGFDEMIKLFLCEETRKTLEDVYGYIEKDFTHRVVRIFIMTFIWLEICFL